MVASIRHIQEVGESVEMGMDSSSSSCHIEAKKPSSLASLVGRRQDIHGFSEIAKHGGIALVHAENGDLIEYLSMSSKRKAHKDWPRGAIQGLNLRRGSCK